MSINSVNLTGRLTRDPDVRYTDGGTSIARFTLAVDRRFRQDDGPTADFPSCVAFGKTAEFIERYFRQGMKLELTGRIQTGSYTNKDGVKVYTTDVIAEQVGFGESKGASQRQENEGSPGGFNASGDDGFMNIPNDVEEELPFN